MSHVTQDHDYAFLESHVLNLIGHVAIFTVAVSMYHNSVRLRRGDSEPSFSLDDIQVSLYKPLSVCRFRIGRDTEGCSPVSLC